MKYLWNGKFFSYGCDSDGSNERDRMMFTGQLTGQFINRYLHWQDTVPAKIELLGQEETGANLHCEVISCPYFHIKRLELFEPEMTNNDGTTCHILFTVRGKIDIQGNGFAENTGPGTSCLMPAALTSYTLAPVEGKAEVLRISLV